MVVDSSTGDAGTYKPLSLHRHAFHVTEYGTAGHDGRTRIVQKILLPGSGVSDLLYRLTRID